MTGGDFKKFYFFFKLIYKSFPIEHITFWNDINSRKSLVVKKIGGQREIEREKGTQPRQEVKYII